MKCSYCNNDIPDGTEVKQDGYFFCNTLHRYAWKVKRKHVSRADGNQATDIPARNSRSYTLEIVIAGIVIACIGLGFVFNYMTGESSGKRNANSEIKPEEAAWETFIKQVNDNCPVKFDSEIQLEHVSLDPEKILTYNYTMIHLSSNDFDDGALRSYFRPKFIDLVNSRDDLKTFRDNRFTFVHKFRNKKGIVLTEIKIIPDDYL